MYQYEYPRPAMSVDIVVCRVIDEAEHLLLIQRKHDPFRGAWALPGGFMDEGETLEQAAARELKEETGLDAIQVTQIGTFSAVDRDPRYRVISTAFVADFDEQQEPVAADDADDYRWVKLEDVQELAFDHAVILEHWKKQRSA